MGKLLSDAQIQAYRRDGYLCPITALSAAEAARYRAQLEAAEAAAGGSLPGRTGTSRTWSTPGRRS